MTYLCALYFLGMLWWGMVSLSDVPATATENFRRSPVASSVIFTVILFITWPWFAFGNIVRQVRLRWTIYCLKKATQALKDALADKDKV